MYPTIILFISIIVSILTIIQLLADYQDNSYGANYKTTFIYGIIASVFWSWLFHLLH